MLPANPFDTFFVDVDNFNECKAIKDKKKQKSCHIEAVKISKKKSKKTLKQIDKDDICTFRKPVRRATLIFQIERISHSCYIYNLNNLKNMANHCRFFLIF